MTITWIIEWLKTTPSTATRPAYVMECGWRCIGNEDRYADSVYGTCQFTQQPEESGNFTPYTELTQDQVLSWCWGSGVSREATEAAVAQQIEAQKNPPLVQPPLPWAN